jgi:GDPmannose 4,6-dehydratase
MNAKKTLITVITDQDGSYLAEFLLEKGRIIRGDRRRTSLGREPFVDLKSGLVKAYKSFLMTP